MEWNVMGLGDVVLGEGESKCGTGKGSYGADEASKIGAKDAYRGQISFCYLCVQV